jgi:hypothetical protein
VFGLWTSGQDLRGSWSHRPVSQLALAAFLGDQGTHNRKSMESFYDIVRSNPELAIFLTLAIGFYVGSLKIGGLALVRL